MIPEYTERPDTLKEYLTSEIKDLLFDELSTDFCRKNGMAFLAGIPLPFTASDVVKISEQKVPVASIADNIVRVMGADPHFAYIREYKMFLARFFDEALVGVILGKGYEQLKAENYRKACVYYRAALVLDGQNRDCVFGYAACTRAWYLSLEGDEEFIDMIEVIKKEANDHFDLTVDIDPEFAPAWYYMGYSCLNQAQYTKAMVCWKHFLQLNKEPESEVYKEIEERLADLKDPVRIEEGINDIISGKLEEGLRILEPYVGGQYENWWPLHYYLACAYRELEYIPEAIEGFKRVISLAPSNYESNVALAELYEYAGEKELAEKYYRKAELVKED